MATEIPGHKAKRAAAKNRKPTLAESLEDEISKLAQAKFVASAAIDSAIALQQAKLPNRVISATHLKAKMGVKLDDVRDELLIRVAEGESVFTICHDAHMPCRSVMYRWIQKDTQFCAEYEAALYQRADKYVEQIADLSEHMQMRAKMGASNEEMTALKTHINSLQWIAAKLNPRKYGEKQHLEVEQTIKLDDKQLDMRLEALLAKARAAQLVAPPLIANELVHEL
jgi:hypothetical protein